MRLHEVTGWKQADFELTRLEGPVDEDVLFGIVKDNDLVITFFGRDLETVLQRDVTQQLHLWLTNSLKSQDGTLGSNSKKLAKLFYDPVRKQILGKARTKVEAHWNKPRPGVAPTSVAWYDHWFLVSKSATVILKPENAPTVARLKQLQDEDGMLDMHGFLGKEAWVED